MGTECKITIKRTTGETKSITCHYDGYIEHAGVMLQIGYNTPEKVEDLLNLGDLSTIGYTINDCRAYHRDCGEQIRFSSYECEYNYTYLERDRVWYVTYAMNDCKEETEAMDWLCLDYTERTRTDLLLDQIYKCNFEGIWKNDQYCRDWADVIPTCANKAREARSELIQESIEKYNSYYNAYFD